MADTIPILTGKTEGSFMEFDKNRYKKEYRSKMISTRQLRKKFDPQYDIANTLSYISETLDNVLRNLKKTKGDTDLPVSEGLSRNDNSEDAQEFFEEGIKDVNPRRDALLRAGATGSAAVYIGEKLEEINENVEEQKEQNKKGFLDKIKSIFGPGGMMAGGLIKAMGGKLGKLGGLALFGALKWDDITESLAMFQSGDFKRGIETLLLGNREKVSTENATGGILKQAGAWAGMGMAIGGPWGALIGGLAGLVGKTIQTGIKITQDAFEQEWDKNVETIMSQKKEALENASGFKEKFKAHSDLFWTGFGSIFAGAKRAAKQAEEEGKSKFAGWFSGFFNTAGGVIEGLLPPEKAKQWREIRTKMKARRKALFGSVNDFFNKSAEYGKDFFTTLQNEGLRGIGNTKIVQDAKEAAKQAWSGFTDRVLKGWNTAKEGWLAMTNEIKEKGLGVYIKEKLEEFAKVMGDFFDKLKSMWESISKFVKDMAQRIGQTIRTKWDVLLGGGMEGVQGIIQRNQEGKLDNKQMLEQLIGIRQVRNYLEDQSGFNLFNVGGGIKKGMQENAYNAMKDILPELIKAVQDGTMENFTSVDDAIIKPGGQVIKTNPNDTIIATQNPGSSNTVVNNFTNRYSPQYVMERLRTVEVY